MAMELDEKPKEEFSDIGGCDKQIKELLEAVVLPMTRSDMFINLGITPPKGRYLGQSPVEVHICYVLGIAHQRARMGKTAYASAFPLSYQSLHEVVTRIIYLSGVLLHGPPGTGKTLLARACANHTKAIFIKLAGPQLVQMYIGDGAKVLPFFLYHSPKSLPLYRHVAKACQGRF